AATAITVSANYAANVAFSADAIQVAMRPPAAPAEGDLALDRIIIVDPRSGIPFESSIWPGYRKVRGEVALARGGAVTSPEHIALLPALGISSSGRCPRAAQVSEIVIFREIFISSPRRRARRRVHVRIVQCPGGRGVLCNGAYQPCPSSP